MIRKFSFFIDKGGLAVLFLVPITAVIFLFNISAFANLAQRNLGLPIQWQSVTSIQWYSLWFLTVLYLALGMVGLYFLRRAFSNFAKGELFNQSNSRDLRLFSIFLFIQALAKPLSLALSSVLLSLNHPPGQQVLSITFGSDEVKMIAIAMILWVVSDLLIKGCILESENKLFI